MNSLEQYTEYQRTLESMIIFVEDYLKECPAVLDEIPKGYDHLTYPLLFACLSARCHAGDARYPTELSTFVNDWCQILKKSIEDFQDEETKPKEEMSYVAHNVRAIIHEPEYLSDTDIMELFEEILEGEVERP